jgi:hypothetical protein
LIFCLYSGSRAAGDLRLSHRHFATFSRNTRRNTFVYLIVTLPRSQGTPDATPSSISSSLCHVRKEHQTQHLRLSDRHFATFARNTRRTAFVYLIVTLPRSQGTPDATPSSISSSLCHVRKEHQTQHRLSHRHFVTFARNT